VTWENTKRAKRSAANRRDYHEERIATARTPRHKVWAACGWLVVEAWQAGLLDEALDWVLSKVHDIRDKEGSDDRHRDYAA